MNGNTFNLEDKPDIDASKSDYILVKIEAGRLKADEKYELHDADVQILQYVGQGTYLCRYKPVDLKPIRDLRFVKGLDIYSPDIVIHPSLRSNNGSQDVYIVLHEDVTKDDGVRQQIAGAAKISVDEVKIEYGTMQLKLSRDQLDRVAQVDSVKFVNPVPQPRLLNNVACQILQVPYPLHNNSHHKGQGQIVCVADTGFDNGNPQDHHPAFPNQVELLFSQRNGLHDDVDGHGTHVCGSVLGLGESNFGQIGSPASGATLHVQSIFTHFDNHPEHPDDPLWYKARLNPGLYQTLFDQACRKGARIHSNSWGSPPTAVVEELIDSYLWENKDFLVLFAAGNDGPQPRSITAEAESKNCITVGASGRGMAALHLQPGTTPPRNGGANNPEHVADFSSRGPTQNGKRYKPDVVSPGTCILSARSSNIIGMRTRGDSTDHRWRYDSGTSMACPLVAGCCAVIRGCLADDGTKHPSAALIKALLINGAVEIMDPQGSRPERNPNNNSGFGRVNLNNSIACILPGRNQCGGYWDGPKLNEITMKSVQVPIDIPKEGSNTLKFTVVWTDPPAEQKELQNVLDLIVTDGRIEKHGNKHDDFPVGEHSDETFDHENNVQQVIWEGVQPRTTYTANVKVCNLTKTTQPFACAWRLY
ncbi:peptidase S8/S53 domain-containing protein [Bisporella sp. PMI_857]|nr:peptidase S8/S53 domain-containing protein [Bisporella sp. PMI_857]